MKIIVRYFFIVFICVCYGKTYAQYTHTCSLEGTSIMAFNGIPLPPGWGNDLEYTVTSLTADERTIGALGGIPFVDIWNTSGGVAIADTSGFQEPFTVKIEYYADSVVLKAYSDDPSNIVIINHSGDYYDGLRTYAQMMEAHGTSVQTAPEWAYDATWETYGFEENWTADSLLALIPVFHQLGIKNITFDSGWYGEGTGEDFYFNTGDFLVNPDIIGTEQDLIDLISSLHTEGFKVRLWWVPGVAEKDINLWDDHPDWYTDSVINSTGEGGDYYLDPTNPNVIAWNTNLVQRFVNYGADGFKQDDIYNYINTNPIYQKAYENLINNNLGIAQAIKPDFMINTCNCGLCQNFYHMKGQNAIITSDPVGSAQYRHRAKYLQAINLNGAAILGDHAELTKGDISSDELNDPAFYSDVDFSSIVPLGMVIQTKFKRDPGTLYQKWFDLYAQYKFYKKEWVNIPLELGSLETYLMRDSTGLYFSFFTAQPNTSYSGNVKFTNLTSGTNYNVYDIVNNILLGNFTSSSTEYLFNANFTHSLVVMVSPYAGVSELLTNEFPDLFIYPNPAGNNITMQFDNPKSQYLNINILNSLGQIISEVADDEFMPGFYKLNADISQYCSGIYSVQIACENGTELRRFILEK